jgi:sortase A
LKAPQTMRRTAGLLVLAVGLWYVGGAGWIHLKALLAQVLIRQAWAENLIEGRPVQRPWSWADTTPVGRLEFVRQRQSMIVLSGDSGRVLAFGPGHRLGSALPGAAGNSVISAHRDTHFAVLQRLRIDDLIQVEDVNGRTTSYIVDRLDVIDEHDLSVTEQQGFDRLTLVTCWPFDAIRPGGAERFVVSASRAGERVNKPRAMPARGAQLH